MVHHLKTERDDGGACVSIEEESTIVRSEKHNSRCEKEYSCETCPLTGSRKFVPWGNAQNPDLMVIIDTAKYGVPLNSATMADHPFIVRLNQCLMSAGLNLNSCYYTFLVRCQTPIVRGVQRQPSAVEVKSCIKSLEKDILTVNPKFILGMGDVILKKFFGPEYNLQKSEGIPLKYGDSIFVGTFPIEIALDVPEKYITFMDTCKRVASWIKKKNNPLDQWDSRNVKFVVTPVDAMNKIVWLKSQNIWSCDIETDSTNLDANLYSIAFSTGDETFAIPFRKSDGTPFWKDPMVYTHFNKALQELFSNNAKKIFHFSTFDALILRQNGIPVRNIADTFLLYYLIDENARNTKLKYLVWKVLGMGGYEAEYDNLTENRSAKGVPTDVLLKYNANDAYATKLLWDALTQKIDSSTRKLMETIVLPFQEVLIEAMHTGLKVDREYATSMINQYKENIAEIEKKLYAAVGHEFDIMSTKDLQKLLYKELKLKCLKRTVKTNAPSVDEEALEALRGSHVVVDLLLEHRKVSKLLSTYFEPILEKSGADNVLHPTFIIGGTRTGRISSRNPNCQNIPRGDTVKNLFISRPGNVLIDLDFKQIEFRMAGHLARDEKMRDDILNGLDIHTEVASRVFRVPPQQVSKTQRTQAKGAVFGILFGRGPASLAKEYGMSEQDATLLINTFLSMYPKVHMWIKTTKAIAKRNGFLRNEFGRTRHFPGIFSKNSEFVSKAERQAVNFLPQSMAADYTFFRAVRLQNLLRKYNTGLILTVHDSLIYEAPLVHIEEVLETIFTELSTPLNFIFVPIDFELSIGFRLGDTVKIENRDDLKKFLENVKNES